MTRKSPLWATLALLIIACTLALLPEGEDDATEPRQTAMAEGHGRTAARGGSVEPTRQFGDLPRKPATRRGFAQTAQGIEVSESVSSTGKRTSSPDPSQGIPGHHLIPPEIRGMKDSTLRERLSETMQGRLARYEEELDQFDPEYRRYLCWGPETPPEVVEAFRRVEGAAGLSAGPVRAQAFQFIGSGRWSQTATDGSGVGEQGLPVTVTWSIVPDGTSAPGDGVPAAPSNLRAWLNTLYPGGNTTGPAASQPWFPLFQEAMADLASQSGLNLVYEPADDGVTITSFAGTGGGELGTRGDIRISARDIDGNSGVLAFAYAPNYGDVVIESYDSFYNTTSNNSRRFINVLTHEIGHALGLGHVCPVNQTKLMEPYISTAYRGAQFDENYSLQRQYADELEAHSGIKNNDSAGNATPITLPTGSLTTWRYLSIDDSTDVDYLAFPAATGETITVRVIPSDPIAPSDPSVDTYLEGAQLSGGCSAGTPFDPTSQQDLTVEVLDTNGSTVLAIANTQAAGATEELLQIPLPGAGTYYLRINGGSANSSQLYELQAELVTATPAPQIDVVSSRIIEESNSGANGVADPGETLLYGVTVRNGGAVSASNLSATLGGSAGFVSFGTTDGAATLNPGASTELTFLFSPAGTCAETIDLSLSVTADGGYSDGFLLPLTLGEVTATGIVDEGFDASSSFPAGWTQSTLNAGSPWTVSSASADTAPNAMFSAGISSAGEAALVSPVVEIGATGASLDFRHSYDLESRQDGAVLEASLDGGAWFDLLESAATVISGGYNDSIRPNIQTSLKRQNVWTGSSGTFITTSLDLPAAWAGQMIQLRWRVVHDSNGAQTGWSVDTVNLISQTTVCDPFRPTVTLTASGTTLNEGDVTSTIDLTLATPLPLVSNVSVTPEISGSGAADDLVSAPSFTLAGGQTSTVATISAAADAQTEGTEQIIFALPTSNPGFGLGSQSSVVVDIEEGLLPATVTLSDLSTTYDGNPHGATVTVAPSGLAMTVTYDGSTSVPTDAATYAVVATVTDPNYTGSASGSFVIAPATATVTLSDLTTTYDGNPQGATVTVAPSGLAMTVTYDGSTSVPTDAATYAVVATVTDPNYTGSTSGNLVIAKASAAVTLVGLDVLYDGLPKAVEVITDPAGLTVTVTYDGNGTVPSGVGGYAVAVTVDDLNYEGGASGTLTIGASFVSWGEGFSLLSPDPLLDDDEDGWINLAEYLFGTNPMDGLSAPTATTALDETTFSLLTSPSLMRPDAVLGAEASATLLQWSSEEVTKSTGGFSVLRSGPSRYLRLTFTYTPGLGSTE